MEIKKGTCLQDCVAKALGVPKFCVPDLWRPDGPTQGKALTYFFKLCGVHWHQIMGGSFSGKHLRMYNVRNLPIGHTMLYNNDEIAHDPCKSGWFSYCASIDADYYLFSSVKLKRSFLFFPKLALFWSKKMFEKMKLWHVFLPLILLWIILGVIFLGWPVVFYPLAWIVVLTSVFCLGEAYFWLMNKAKIFLGSLK